MWSAIRSGLLITDDSTVKGNQLVKEWEKSQVLTENKDWVKSKIVLRANSGNFYKMTKLSLLYNLSVSPDYYQLSHRKSIDSPG